MQRLVIYFLLSVCGLNLRAADQAMLGYSMTPNAYLNDHAADVKKIYDGFFFSVGSWENARARFEGPRALESEWLDMATRNLAALRRSGVTENFLTVAFEKEARWPTGETLRSHSYTDTMVADFRAIARTARRLGFRGVCVDVEYPYPRYELDHPIYGYEDYTAWDLLRGARAQGRSVMEGMLDEFPDAVMFSLPGEIRTRPIAREFVQGMLEAMARRDSPGGFHLGNEFTYSMNEPVTHLASTRLEDVAMSMLVDASTRAYWKRRCTMAPGVWPLHMLETGGSDYEPRPWKREMELFAEEMGVLRAAAKRYLWSYSDCPLWYVHTPELESKYGLRPRHFRRSDVDLRLVQQLLASRQTQVPARFAPLLESIRRFDADDISADELCRRFGAPPSWSVLGYVSNFKVQPQFAAEEALDEPINDQIVYQGRDSGIRWFTWRNLDPRGLINPRWIFGYRNTNNAGIHFSTYIDSPEARPGFVHVGWDDVVVVRWNGKIILDTRKDKMLVKGFYYRDQHCFERALPVTIDKGANRLVISTYNFKGAWALSARVTGEAGVPVSDLQFRPR